VQFAANSRRINPVVVVFRIGFTFTSHLLLRISVLTSLTLYQHAGICIMNEEVGRTRTGRSGSSTICISNSCTRCSAT